MNPNDPTPTQQVARLKGTDHTEQLYKLAMEQAEELERVKKSYALQRESHEVEIYAWGQRNAQLSRQVEELNKRLLLCNESTIKRVQQENDQLRAENTMINVQNDSLDRELTRRDNENAELLKDKKRLERLMTLERGDLLWFHQEQDKRRALDILMEDNE